MKSLCRIPSGARLTVAVDGGCTVRGRGPDSRLLGESPLVSPDVTPVVRGSLTPLDLKVLISCEFN